MEDDWAFIHFGYGDARVTNVVFCEDGTLSGICRDLRMPVEENSQIVEEFVRCPKPQWKAKAVSKWEAESKILAAARNEGGYYFGGDDVALKFARESLAELAETSYRHFWCWEGADGELPVNVVEACAAWQGGRDTGSSLIRAGARLLTGVPHYFEADFIDHLDTEVAQQDEVLSYTRTLLDAVHHSQRRSSDGWSKRLFLSGGRTAMRGIASKQGQEEIDSAIESLVLTPGATISMPLWGFSLDEKVALGYGTRFVFRLRGEFNAVPTWAYSRLRQDELELIGGGTYAVVDTQTEGDSLVVDLEQV